MPTPKHLYAVANRRARHQEDRLAAQVLDLTNELARTRRELVESEFQRSCLEQRCSPVMAQRNYYAAQATVAWGALNQRSVDVTVTGRRLSERPAANGSGGSAAAL